MSLSHYFMDTIGRLIGFQLSIQEASISLKRISEIYKVTKEQVEEDKIKIEKNDADEMEFYNKLVNNYMKLKEFVVDEEALKKQNYTEE